MQRHYIYLEKDTSTKTLIAQKFGVVVSTISRTITQNKSNRNYYHQQADQLAKARYQDKPKRYRLSDNLFDSVIHYVKQDWSPEQIPGYLKTQKSVSVHHETIYRYLVKDKDNKGNLE